jgi:uncharacterized membrane protein YraQ (UPF0718 family)
MDLHHVAELGVQSAGLAFAMAWSVLWSLILGFVLSGLVQGLVPQAGLQRVLGDDSPRALGLAALFGAASSSCSYASAAISRSLFARGAGFSASMAFLIASTNLVVELGLVLWLLMGWQFALAEWLGGVVLIGVMAVLVRLTASRNLIESARAHAREAGGGMHAADPVAGATLGERLRNPDLPVRVAQSFAADVRMLWKDVAVGFVIAGVLGACVPAQWWAALFLHDAPAWLRVPVDALLAPLIAMVSFVCSIGNVPMAAVLWGSGIGFGGVLAFLYADLIVLPLLDVYRRAYGLRMAAYMACILYATMVISGLIMQAVFHAGGLVPARIAFHGGGNMGVHFDLTTVANLLAIAGAVALFAVARRHPAMAKHCCGHHAAPAHR